MNLIDTIIKRRSIRRFTSLPVTKEMIEAMIRAAMYAPSAVNKQPWHFIVVDDRKIMDEVMSIHPNSKMLSSATLAVLVCGDEKLQHDTGYWIADCGAATENLLIAATSLGLGSCWIGVYPRENRMEAFSALFKLPAHIRPFALVALGHPAEEKLIPARFDQSKIFLNTWANPYFDELQ